MTVPNMSTRTSGGGSGHGAGILGVAGLLLEIKHGIPVIFEPFAACHSIWDVMHVISGMEDGGFLGLVLWVSILLASSFAASVGLASFVKKLLSRHDDK